MSWTAHLREERRDFILGHGLYHFCKQTGVCPDIVEQPHREMCAEIEVMEPPFASGTRQRRKLYLAPRYTYKTSLIVAFDV